MLLQQMSDKTHNDTTYFFCVGFNKIFQNSDFFHESVKTERCIYGNIDIG